MLAVTHDEVIRSARAKWRVCLRRSDAFARRIRWATGRAHRPWSGTDPPVRRAV